jgi:hypothetical protein
MVDSIYKKLGGNLKQKKGTVEVQKYECRLRKSQKSSTARPATDEKKIKRRHSSIRIAGQCEVQIKVTRSLIESVGVVTIERTREQAYSTVRRAAYLLLSLRSSLLSPMSAYFLLFVGRVRFWEKDQVCVFNSKVEVKDRKQDTHILRKVDSD